MKNSSSKPQKMKVYDSFLDWKKDQSLRNQRLITKLTSLVKETAPYLTPTVKWGQGCWVDNGKPRVFIHAEEDHVQFGFYNGATFKDPEKVLIGKGKYVRHIKVYTQKDIVEAVFTNFIQQAIK